MFKEYTWLIWNLMVLIAQSPKTESQMMVVVFINCYGEEKNGFELVDYTHKRRKLFIKHTSGFCEKTKQKYA